MNKTETLDISTHRKLLENLFDGVYSVDINRKITFWNKAAERITGYSQSEVLGHSCQDNILRHIDENGQELCHTGCPLACTILDGNQREEHLYLHHKQGHRVPVSIRLSPVKDAKGAIIGALEIFSDNSNLLQIIKEMEKLKNEAYLDELTSIGNRKYGQMILNSRMHDWQTFNIPFGLIMLDLDYLKRFNNSYGHRIGDEILVMVGRTLTNILRRMDSVSRWKGEKFVVILPHIDDATLGQVAERIRAFIESNFLVAAGDLINITASIGATMARPDDTAETIVKRAETMMNASKKKGRNRITFW
jgi:diguanylate cyclase (GGDEF)-like protein/PAS domain S-box-containing protein